MPKREVGQVVGKSIEAKRLFSASQISFPLQAIGRKSAANFYSTLALSTRPIFANSTRHSVTSRIRHNSRSLSYLIFSSRHLNATPEKAPTC